MANCEWVYDMRLFGLPSLQPLSSFDASRYRGPTVESNWIIPQVFLGGAFPGKENEDLNDYFLLRLLKLGINTFVSLQEEYPLSEEESINNKLVYSNDLR